jgi:polar amino acid transport system substrate-binding protein
MKKLTLHAALLLALISFVMACNTLVSGRTEAGAGAAQTSTLSRITQRGELVLGTSGNMPPMTEKRADGKVVGFDIDLARLMATGMNVKLKTEVMPCDQLLPALERGDVDVVISNLTMTPERNLRAAFVGPYMTSGKCVITRRQDLAKADQAEDINVPATRLAALAGSTSADFVKTLLPKATLVLVQSNEEGVKLISDNKVDGMLADYPICLWTLEHHPDDGFVSLFTLLNYEPIGIALPAGDAQFINWTENFLQRVQGVGLFEELSKRWFGRILESGEGK